jgi:hypothetical protein
MSSEEEAAAAELKRKRLEAWRKRLEEQKQKPTVPTNSIESGLNEPSKFKLGKGFSLKVNSSKKNGKRNINTFKNESGSLWEFNDDGHAQRDPLNLNIPSKNSEKGFNVQQQRQKRNRWDSNPMDASHNLLDGSASIMKDSSQSMQSNSTISEVDALDQFMDHLNAGALGSVTIQDSSLSINVSGSMIGKKVPLHSGGTITFDDLNQLKQGSDSTRKTDPNSMYSPSDWESEKVFKFVTCIICRSSMSMSSCVIPNICPYIVIRRSTLRMTTKKNKLNVDSSKL